MAPRPAGGWQVGSLIMREPAPDYEFALGEWYTVKWTRADVCEVRHFEQLRRDADPVNCCAVQVTITDKDRRGTDPDPRVNALHRAYLYMERKHGRR
jgi:hypothetical protein